MFPNCNDDEVVYSVVSTSGGRFTQSALRLANYLPFFPFK